MRKDEAFPGKYLKAADVKANPITAKISYVEMETVGQGKDQKEKPVLYFEDLDRPLVLNSTNWDAIADVLGDESDNWAGHKIKLFSVRTQYAGKPTDGIRVEVIKNEA
jgi:hypothetical protein